MSILDSIRTQITTAQQRLSTLVGRVTAAEQAERDATRALANDPSDKTIARAKDARATLDALRGSQQAVSQELEAASAELAEAERAAKAQAARDIAAECTLTSTRAALGPIVAECVEHAREGERLVAELLSVIATAQRKAAAARALAAEAGIAVDVPDMHEGFARAVLVVALTRADLAMPLASEWFRGLPPSPSREAELAAFVFGRLGLGQPRMDREPAEQIDTALGGGDLYADMRGQPAAAPPPRPRTSVVDWAERVAARTRGALGSRGDA